MTGWTALIAAHATAASLALVLGPAQLLRRRFGDRAHRWIGGTWVALMGFVAVSSFRVQRLRPGHFSWIHVLSPVTVVTLVLGVVAIRRHDVRTHAISMSSNLAGLVGAFIGVVAVPTRLIPESFQHDWAGMTALSLAVVTAALAGVAALSAAARRVPLLRR